MSGRAGPHRRMTISRIDETHLSSPFLDVVVLGARTQEKNALHLELSKASAAEPTGRLKERLRKSGASIPVFAIKDSTATDDRHISVGLLECSDMGNVASAINTAQVIVQHEPSLVIFSGIAGSLNSKKYRIGDVFFPRFVRTRYFQKLKSYSGDYMRLGAAERAEMLEQVSGQLLAFDKTISVTDTARNLLSHVSNQDLNRILQTAEIPEDWSKSHGLLGRRTQVVDEEYSFCWDKVLSNQKYIDAVRSLLGNTATIVDMESYGFLSALEKLRGSAKGTNNSLKRYATNGIIIRSVSDYAEYKDLSDSDPKWRDLGLSNMAIATRYVIEKVFGSVF